MTNDPLEPSDHHPSAAQNVPDARPQGARRPERTEPVREDLRPTENEADGRFQQPARLGALDHAHLWHPFTQMQEWVGEPPLVIAEGDGGRVRDTEGRWYLEPGASSHSRRRA